jgi:NAD(P)H dehydrogenase (quinone)
MQANIDSSRAGRVRAPTPLGLRLGIPGMAHFWLAMALVSASAQSPTITPATNSTHVLVAYYSLSGHTETMAHAVADGVRRIPGVTVTLRKVGDVTAEDLRDSSGIILGCPTYYGTLPGRMKALIDDWSWKMKVDFTDKIGGAFATGGGQTGGKELVVLALLTFMLNNRMIVAGPLYRNERTGSVWAEIGASATTGPLDPGVGDHERDGARRLGERIARLCRSMDAHNR